MQKIAVFDFDGTIIDGDSVVDMLLQGRKNGYVSFFQLLRAATAGALYHLRLTGPMQSKRAAHAFLKEMPPQGREAFLQEFAQSLINRARPEALKQIAMHKQAGDTFVLCSASGSCYMRYVAELLQADALLCTPCDEFGLPNGVNCRGEEKVRRVEKWMQENKLSGAVLVAGYGDTAGDAPILKKCQKPVLVRPRKKLVKLMPTAEIADWKSI